jgi:hypothetical protein
VSRRKLRKPGPLGKRLAEDPAVAERRRKQEEIVARVIAQRRAAEATVLRARAETIPDAGHVLNAPDPEPRRKEIMS